MTNPNEMQALKSRMDAIEHLMATSICVMTSVMGEDEFNAYMNAFTMTEAQALGLMSPLTEGASQEDAARMFINSIQRSCSRVKDIRNTMKLLNPAND